MKRLNTYELSKRNNTPLIQINGSNCGTKHFVPDYLTESLTHALMDFVYGRRSLPAYVEDTRSRVSERNLKDAFTLQALGLVRVDGAKVCIFESVLPLIKRLKRDGWYYWYGTQNEFLTDELTRSGRLIKEGGI